MAEVDPTLYWSVTRLSVPAAWPCSNGGASARCRHFLYRVVLAALGCYQIRSVASKISCGWLTCPYSWPEHDVLASAVRTGVL